MMSFGRCWNASRVSQSPRTTSRDSAWYFAVFADRFGSRPEKLLHGGERNTTSGASPPVAAAMSAGVASRQPSGGGSPWNAS